MLEICQNLPFGAKVRNNIRRVKSGADQFDRHALFKRGIDPHGAIDRPHAALAYQLYQPVLSDFLADCRIGGVIFHRLVVDGGVVPEFFLHCGSIGGKQLTEFLQQCTIPRARRLKKTPSLSWR